VTLCLGESKTLCPEEARVSMKLARCPEYIAIRHAMPQNVSAQYHKLVRAAKKAGAFPGENASVIKSN
jgi:hypothetical protein